MFFVKGTQKAISRIIGMLGALRKVAGDIWRLVSNRNAIPIYYYTHVDNVGDMLAPYLISKLLGRDTLLIKTPHFKRLLAVGSILQFATKNSCVWGSGVISPQIVPKACQIDQEKIFALRGQLTQKRVSELVGEKVSVPLGDPAVLMSDVFQPQVERHSTIGVVPHYVDHDSVSAFCAMPGVKLISVNQAPESFVRELLGCSMILSSSLHGLILADSYGIPNKWAIFSDSVLGGEYKFHDYYSVTDNHDEQALRIYDANDFSTAVQDLKSLVSVKRYTGSKSELRAALLRGVLCCTDSQGGERGR